MAVLQQCFCLSLRQGSFIIGSYAVIVYCVAFAIELWWIVESLLILPAPAYTLCALYFFNFIMAAVLLFGLLVRERKYLMSWTLMTILSFFPEAGMVLFMSLYYWPGSKYEYGVVELVYWSIRAMFNIFGVVCVCSLYLTWRDEELILERLHDLTLASVDDLESQQQPFSLGIPPGYHQGYQNQNHSSSGLSVLGRHLGEGHHGHGTLRHFTLDGLSSATLGKSKGGSGGGNTYNNLAFQNLAFIPGDLSLKSGLFPSSGMVPMGVPTLSKSDLRQSLLRSQKMSEFNPGVYFDPHRKQRIIEELGIAGVGLEDFEGQGLYGQQGPGLQHLHKTRSMWTFDDYMARPPPSRPVSISFLNYSNGQSDHIPSELDLYNNSNINTLLAHKRSLSQSHLHLGTLRNNQGFNKISANAFYGYQPNSAKMINPLANANVSKNNLLLNNGGIGKQGSVWGNEFKFQGRRAQSMDALNFGNSRSMNSMTLGPQTTSGNAIFLQRYYGNNSNTANNNNQVASNQYSDLTWRRSLSKSSDASLCEDDEECSSYQDIPL